MMLFLAAFLGAIFNRIRGGWLEQYIPAGKAINALGYGAFIFGLTDWLTGLLSVVAMFAGQSLGWGRYIGKLGGWDKLPYKEVEAIDWIIWPLEGRPRLWGFAGLSLRGGVWGAALALPILAYQPILAGMCMGVVYLITIEIARVTVTNHAGKPEPARGWEWGEIAFGALLWAAVVWSV